MFISLLILRVLFLAMAEKCQSISIIWNPIGRSLTNRDEPESKFRQRGHKVLDYVPGGESDIIVRWDDLTQIGNALMLPDSDPVYLFVLVITESHLERLLKWPEISACSSPRRWRSLMQPGLFDQHLPFSMLQCKSCILIGAERGKMAWKHFQACYIIYCNTVLHMLGISCAEMLNTLLLWFTYRTWMDTSS